MQSDFANSLARILVYEGGKVDDPRDPGGRTNKGITQATFTAWLRQQGKASADVYDITDADVATIYKNEYWARVSGDQLPVGLDLCVFDGAVNSGCSQSVKWLQQALGTDYKGAIDGLMGTQTLATISAQSGDEKSLEDLIGAYCSHRLATLQRLPTWGTFGAGWHSRIANVLKTADAWVAGADAPNPRAAGQSKALVSTIKPSVVSQGAVHATTTLVGAGAFASQVAPQVTAVQAAYPHWHWVTVVMAALTATSALSGIGVKVIANAKDAATKGSATATVNLDADAGSPEVPITDKKAT